jgi:hypothetical protein
MYVATRVRSLAGATPQGLLSRACLDGFGVLRCQPEIDKGSFVPRIATTMVQNEAPPENVGTKNPEAT